MKIVGLTGGIGSGKSVVGRIFTILGVPVFNADEESRKLMDEDLLIREQLSGWFGEQVYKDGKLDRPRLAGIIFSNQELLSKVNSLVHPRVMNRFLEWRGENPDNPYLIHEAAILFESGFYRHMDRTILVTAPENVRIGRIILRDNTSAEAVRQRMKNQWTDEQKIPLADYIINNNGESLLTPLILEIHQKLID